MKKAEFSIGMDIQSVKQKSPKLQGTIERNPLSAAKLIENTKNQALSKFELSTIQSLDKKSLIGLQSLLQHGTNFGFWQTPADWVVGSRSQCTRNIDLRSRIVHFLPQHIALLANFGESSVPNSKPLQGELSRVRLEWAVENALLTATRYLILLRVGPAGMGSRCLNSNLSVRSILQIAYNVLPRIFSASITSWFDTVGNNDSKSIFDSLNSRPAFNFMSQLDGALNNCKLDKKSIQELARMRELNQRSLWHDIPSTAKAVNVTATKGPAKPEVKQPVVEKHLPLPDDYVSEMAHRSLWLINQLAPNLFVIGNAIKKIWSETDLVSLEASQVESKRRYLIAAYLKKFEWRDSNGVSISSPPFSIRLIKSSPKSVGKLDSGEDAEEALEHEKDIIAEELIWPPRSFLHVAGLLQNLQLAHLFVVALSEGARTSEILSHKRNCIERSRDGIPYASGRTYKLVQSNDGMMRDWLLPEIAVKAIEQQVRLVALAEGIDTQSPSRETNIDVKMGDHLWAQMFGAGKSDRKKPMQDLAKCLVSYAKAIGMDTRPGGQNLRPHRLRKTLARLVALALTDAPKILMGVFGHKSIEMTLYYILSDKNLRAEIEEVSRDLRVMRAKDAVEKIHAAEQSQSKDVDLGGFGGPAALMIRSSITTHKEQLHRLGKEWNVNSAMELAEILTIQGKAWTLVRKGVVCTKLPGTETGPCNKSLGHPEPSRCSSQCQHRLEDEFLKNDVDSVIAEAVEYYNNAVKSANPLMSAMWAAQIRANIPRFPSLQKKWEKNETVQRVFSN